MPRLITLLTDFGTADGYVGEMKGVLASLAPLTSIVDVAHDVAPHDIDGARLALARYWRRFPAGTVHLVVVDPGVGSARGALAATSEGRFLVGPDNGVLSPALLHADARCVSLAIPSGVAPTFHGRDVFAPAAAQLAQGASLESLGDIAESPVIRRTPEATRRRRGAGRGDHRRSLRERGDESARNARWSGAGGRPHTRAAAHVRGRGDGRSDRARGLERIGGGRGQGWERVFAVGPHTRNQRGAAA